MELCRTLQGEKWPAGVCNASRSSNNQQRCTGFTVGVLFLLASVSETAAVKTFQELMLRKSSKCRSAKPEHQQAGSQHGLVQEDASPAALNGASSSPWTCYCFHLSAGRCLYLSTSESEWVFVFLAGTLKNEEQISSGKTFMWADKSHLLLWGSEKWCFQCRKAAPVPQDLRATETTADFFPA